MLNNTHFEFSTYAYDDLKLYGQGWSPTMPKALILLIHDLGEDSNHYQHLGKFLCHQGYALMVMDSRGSGKSDGNTETEVFYSLLMHDVRKLIKSGRQKFEDLPIFLMGCGYGGNLALNYAIRIKNELNGIIAVSPWLKLAFKMPSLRRNLEKPERLNLPILPEKKNLTLQHLQVITGAGLFALEYSYTLDKPTLVIHGTEDKITSPIASKTFSVGNPNYVQTWLYRDCKHTILQDALWERVATDLVDWLQLIIIKQAPSTLSIVGT